MENLGGLRVEWNTISGNHQSGANNANKVDRDSDMAPAYWLYGGTLTSATTPV